MGLPALGPAFPIGRMHELLLTMRSLFKKQAYKQTTDKAVRLKHPSKRMLGVQRLLGGLCTGGLKLCSVGFHLCLDERSI